jgi:hypothetical protein
MTPPGRMLLAVYGAAGGLGIGFVGFFAFVIARASRGGPGDVGLAVVAGVLLLAQGGLVAGLPALALHHRVDSRRTLPANVAVAAGTVALLLGALFVTTALLLVLVAGGAGMFVARRLARMHRGWIVGWLIYATACLTADAFTLWFWLAVLGGARL